MTDIATTTEDTDAIQVNGDGHLRSDWACASQTLGSAPPVCLPPFRGSSPTDASRDVDRQVNQEFHVYAQLSFDHDVPVQRPHYSSRSTNPSVTLSLASLLTCEQDPKITADTDS